jgi:hypothetical protein
MNFPKADGVQRRSFAEGSSQKLDFGSSNQQLGERGNDLTEICEARDRKKSLFTRSPLTGVITNTTLYMLLENQKSIW